MGNFERNLIRKTLKEQTGECAESRWHRKALPVRHLEEPRNAKISDQKYQPALRLATVGAKIRGRDHSSNPKNKRKKMNTQKHFAK